MAARFMYCSTVSKSKLIFSSDIFCFMYCITEAGFRVVHRRRWLRPLQGENG